MAFLDLGTINTENNGTTIRTTSAQSAFNVDNPQGIGVTVTSGTDNAITVTSHGGPIRGSVYVDSQKDAIHVVTRDGGMGVTVDASAGRSGDRFVGGTGIKVITRRGGTGVDVVADGTGVNVNASQDPGIVVNSGGTGVTTFSIPSPGVVGQSVGSMGIFGITSSPSWAGVVGFNTIPGGRAGIFFGGLVCTGPKNAAVRHPDGAHRLLHSLESPESWFEDFGRARLVRGKAQVTLDPTFVVLVRGDYHVFLSPEGECKGLYVARLTRGGFEVREQGKGASDIAFSYRVVARRKDVKAPRFQKIKLENPRQLLGRMPKRVSIPKPPARVTVRAARRKALRESQ